MASDNREPRKTRERTMNNRDQAIARIKTALKTRSGKAWSVTGGRGTAWGWITITATPKRRIEGDLCDADRSELATLMGLNSVHRQGIDVAASSVYYAEYVDRAEGRTPAKIAEPYWD